MTCIAGLVKDGVVWMGGDSAASSETSICIRRDTKVFKNGDFLLGYCGSFRLGQLMRYKFEAPDHNSEKTEVFEYMVNEFSEAVRTLVKEHGLSKIEDNVEELVESQLLIGYCGRLFVLEEDFQIGEIVNDYYAIGAGADLALGSLFTTSKQKRNLVPRKRLELALEAAATFCTSVAAPFSIQRL